jgi:hypothetical protein
MTDLVENGSSSITFAVLLILRLRWRLWIDYSLTVFASGHAPWQTELGRRIIWL